LAEGVYLVSAATRQMAALNGGVGMREDVQYYPGVIQVVDAQDLVLRPGDEKLGVDFSGLTTQANEMTVVNQTGQPNAVIVVNGRPMMPTPILGAGVIRGRITRSDGLPIAHATVSTQAPVSQLGRTTTGNRSVQTNDDGTYEFVDLPAGQYRVTAA